MIKFFKKNKNLTLAEHVKTALGFILLRSSITILYFILGWLNIKLLNIIELVTIISLAFIMYYKKSRTCAIILFIWCIFELIIKFLYYYIIFLDNKFHSDCFFSAMTCYFMYRAIKALFQLHNKKSQSPR